MAPTIASIAKNVHVIVPLIPKDADKRKLAQSDEEDEPPKKKVKEVVDADEYDAPTTDSPLESKKRKSPEKGKII